MKPNNMTRDTLLFLPAKIIEGIILMLTTSSLYTAVLSENAYGTFQIVNTTILFLYLVLSGWLANASNRYVGEENSKDNGRSIYSTIFVIYSITFIILSIILLIIFLNTKEIIYLLSILMYAAYTLFQILNGIMVQLGKSFKSIVCSLSNASLKFIIVIIAIQISPHFGQSPVLPILAVAFSDVFSAILSIIFLKPYVKIKYFSKTLLKKFLSYGVPLLGVSISVGLLNMIDRYLVVYKFGADGFATYSANYAIASGIFAMINVAVMRGVYPAVLKCWRENTKDETKKLLSSGVRLYLLIAMPACFGLLGISNSLSTLLFVKQSYHAGSIIIGLTAVSMVFMGLTEYANKAYELEANTMPVLQNSLVATIVKIISSIVLLNLFGIIGGAIGSILSFLTYFVITSLRVKKKFIFKLKNKTWFSIISASSITLIVANIVSNLKINNLLSIILAVFFSAISYFLVLLISGECKQEFKYIKNIIIKRRIEK